MEAEPIDTLMAQNKALAQKVNLLNSKLGTMQLAAANTQIGTCDLCGIQGHSSESCAAILEQQSSEQVNYMALQKLTLSTTTFVDGTTNFINETKATLKNQEASIRNLEVQVGQIAKQLTEKSPNTFPNNTIANPKEECNAIQLRSGKKVENKLEEPAEGSSKNQQEKEDATPPKVAEPAVPKPVAKVVPKQNSAAAKIPFP
ncbi:hypothetical protein PIB30_052087 [Stylosanthes scabra]|uniref:Uncharacterized protein n=1 Tax=Stylosanthes scabra TaxID=79078 RepID=A0ABU6QJU6_9FABA|nr:hypothetical protein [Stylosanthes scabra]